MRSAIVLLLFTLGAAALTGCDRQAPGNGQAEQAEPATPEPAATLAIEQRGEPMPDLAITGIDGEPARLSDFRGKPVLVNLWATWCAPCVKEMPSLDALAARADGRLTVLTVSQDIKGAAVVTPWFAKRRFAKIEPWLDPDNALSIHYGTGILPTSVLYDAQGREVWRTTGGMDWTGARANTLLAEVLG